MDLGWLGLKFIKIKVKIKNYEKPNCKKPRDAKPRSKPFGPIVAICFSPSSYSKLQPLLIDSPTVALHLLCPLVAQSHPKFNMVPNVKLWGIMSRNRYLLTTFIISTTGQSTNDVNIGGCNQPMFMLHWGILLS